MTTPNEKPDGGPAFPVPYAANTSGLFLRDYFAAAALNAYASNPNLTEEKVARYAYEIADAMLAARQTKGQP